VARLQGIEGQGMAGLGQTFGSLWLPHALRLCSLVWYVKNGLLPFLSDIGSIRLFDGCWAVGFVDGTLTAQQLSRETQDWAV
jgi:hypothetical protein